jgi:hypothetical protein
LASKKAPTPLTSNPLSTLAPSVGSMIHTWASVEAASPSASGSEVGTPSTVSVIWPSRTNRTGARSW